MKKNRLTSSSNFDVTIIGGGVIGLSLGNALLESNPKLRVVVVEKEKKLGQHASGRNSGVIHAGFYYSPESLKSKFCREGNFELRNLCKRNEIPVMETGKVVVTQSIDEEYQLDDLFKRGIRNGVELEMHESKELKKFEPLAKTLNRFLWSPTSAVSNPDLVLSSMANEYIEKGGVLKLDTSVQLADQSGEIVISNKSVAGNFYVNASGVQADRISRNVGVGLEYAMVPFMGVYRAVSNQLLGLRTLVYPVPHPINPFLGVHCTLTVIGKIKIGPTAIPILGREQYSVTTGWSVDDIRQAIKATRSLINGESHNVSKMIASEWPKIKQGEIVKQASRLVPKAQTIRSWSKLPPGIRSQLVHLPTGKLEQDFKVELKSNSLHILNAVSPGWTSSIPFARYVASLIPK
jgi:L-2-hydroxyglutarate oxidase